MWQHTCSLESPEFKDTLLIASAKKGSEHTPEEHTIISCALKHKKAQARASRPAVLEPIKTLVLRYNTSVSNLCSEVKTYEHIKLLL